MAVPPENLNFGSDRSDLPVLVEIVETLASVIGAEGGAVGIVDRWDARLGVTDTYPKLRSAAEKSSSFSLPIGGNGRSSWRKTVDNDRPWTAELDDSRFTEGFRRYHASQGRQFFLHFPILLSGRPIGFIGQSFMGRRTVEDSHLKLGHLMAHHAVLAIQSHQSQMPSEDAGLEGKRAFSVRVVSLIDQLIAESRWSGLRTAELALATGYSARQFHFLFTKACGQTPHAWIMNRRLEFAHKRLIAGDPVALVAFSFGFADHAHFARQYRAKFGYPPSQALHKLPC